MILLYNKTKIGVDMMDQMVDDYISRRQTRRWPMRIFYNIIDIAALNAYIIMRTQTARTVQWKSHWAATNFLERTIRRTIKTKYEIKDQQSQNS